MIRPVSSQIADFLRLVPTPANSDEVSPVALNRMLTENQDESALRTPGFGVRCVPYECEHVLGRRFP